MICSLQITAPPVIDTSDMDPELAKYLNRNYWEKKSEEQQNQVSTTQPSAPVAANEAVTSTTTTPARATEVLFSSTSAETVAILQIFG